MIEAAMIWNEPNNKSHWDLELDPGWARFSEMARLAGQAIAAERPGMLRVLGGISPIDPGFIRTLAAQGGLSEVDVVGVHGFPLDWNLWPIDDWPAKLDEIRAATFLPLWITEVGASSFGAEAVQDFGLARTAELLIGQAPRIHWYSLFDLPSAWEATTRHKEAEGSAYWRHFAMGLIDQQGRPKQALARFEALRGAFGICQWLHFEDHRLNDLVRWLDRLNVRHLRTGLSWADWLRPGAPAWFDRMMAALEPFEVTVTFCFTPESEGIAPHHTAAPREPARFAAFCAAMLRRYA